MSEGEVMGVAARLVLARYGPSQTEVRDDGAIVTTMREIRFEEIEEEADRIRAVLAELATIDDEVSPDTSDDGGNTRQSVSTVRGGYAVVANEWNVGFQIESTAVRRDSVSVTYTLVPCDSTADGMQSLVIDWLDANADEPIARISMRESDVHVRLVKVSA